jgi:DNA polymerase III delta prime subunit
MREEPGGGLEIPDVVVESWIDDPSNCSPIILLISGPAGTGKTTLAMELVYRLSSQGITDPTNTRENHKFPSVYISSESPGQLLIESKVPGLGWKPNRFQLAGIPEENGDAADNCGKVHIVGRDAEHFQNAQNPAAFFQQILNYCSYRNLVSTIGSRSGIVVLDSLNVLDPDERGNFYLDLVNRLRGPFLMVVVLDSAPGDTGDPFWSFAADTIIRLTQVEREDPRVGTYLVTVHKTALRA